MGHQRKRIDSPVSDMRRKRFETWLRHAPSLDLDRVYARALKTRNIFQKIAVLTELRRREQEDAACGST